MKLKIGLVISILFLGVFFYSHSAHANYAQPNTNGYFFNTTGGAGYIEGQFNNNGATSTVISDAFADTGVGSFWASTSTAFTAFVPFTQISSISIFVRNLSNNNVLSALNVGCTDGTGSHTSTAATAYWSPDDGQFHAVNYVLPTPITCDSTTTTGIGAAWTFPTISLSQYQILGTNDASVLTPNVGVSKYNSYPVSVNYNFNITFSINGHFTPLINPDQPSTLTSACLPTSFTFNAGFTTVDFGQGICSVTNYLFVPSQASLNRWTDTKTLMATKAPFSYFYSLTNTIETLPTSTLATITPLTLGVGSGTPLHISFDAFSANTINQYTDSNSRGIVRTLIKYGLYLLFIAMIILEVRHLFKGKNTPQ